MLTAARILTGYTTHTRFLPCRHYFKYPVLMLDVPLANVSELDRSVWGFGFNRWSVWSLRERDYLGREPDTLMQKVRRLLCQYEIDCEDVSIRWVTSPKWMGYGFNPITFYYVYDLHERPIAVLVEVHNTYHEGHVYPCVLDESGKAAHSKTFHVSPFFDEKGRYSFKFSFEPMKVDIRYDIDDECQFHANLVFSHQTPFSTGAMWRSFGRYPVTTALTMPRILWQAAVLYYRKKIPAKSRPVPMSDATIRRLKPSVWQKISQKFVVNALSRTCVGNLELEGPSGERWSFGEGASEPVVLKVHDYRFFTRLIRFGEVGFGESYMKGEWTIDDLTGCLHWFIRNEDFISKRHDRGGVLPRAWNAMRHHLRRNTKRNSRRNISEHYDLSNAFYQRLLDPSMMYSAAVFPSEDVSLADAQQFKIQKLIRLARVEASHHVLEIGSGWGSMAIALAQQVGCRVTTITLSSEQYDYVSDRIQKEGVMDLVDVQLIDYRDLKGQFDRIISIEMIEAVGHRFLPVFVQQLNQLCKQDGLVVMQAICIPDQCYHTYRKKTDFIKQYIFPGGHLPSLQHLSQLFSRFSAFNLEYCDNIALDYARTLECWRHQFESSLDEIRADGFSDEFIRMWRFYLSYSEAAFESRYLGSYQLVWRRYKNEAVVPVVRND